METYAGHYYPEPVIGCAYGPVIPGMYENTLSEGARRTLGKCTYGIWNEDAYQLYMDVETLMKLFDTLDDTSLRAAKIAEALEQFTLIVDFEQDREKRNSCYREAIEKLRPVMEAENGSTMPVFYAVGNAHIDLAWLWPMAETKRKTARTFAAQLRLLEEYPEYKFIQSQPAAYEMCREYYPELFERIKEAVKGGQWIAEGGMWVEPDTNIAGGEALIRQLLYGKKYYKEVFKVEKDVSSIVAISEDKILYDESTGIGLNTEILERENYEKHHNVIITEENIYPYAKNVYSLNELESILTEEQTWADDANRQREEAKREEASKQLLFPV